MSNNIIETHVHFTAEEFMALATLAMCNDNEDERQEDGICTETIHSALDQIAIKCLGFDDWMQAYNRLDK